MADPTSVAELLRQSVENAADVEPLVIRIPVFNPPLQVSLRKLKDAKQVDAAMKGTDRLPDEATQAIEIAARTLVLASVDTFVDVEGQRVSFGRLGSAVLKQIFPDREAPASDVEAVYALYTGSDGQLDSISMTQAAAEYNEWRNNAIASAQHQVLGESLPGDTRPAT